MDELDRAARLEELERTSCVNRVRAQGAGPKLEPMGECHYCGEEVDPPRLFCDKTCAQAYDARLKRLRAMGRSA